MITVDQLFAEEFKPEWMQRQEHLIKHSFEQAITTTTNYAYGLFAAETRRRIVSRVDERNRYRNPSGI